MSLTGRQQSVHPCFLLFDLENVMIKNVGSADKVIRLVLGVLLLAWSVFGLGLASTVSYVALVVGVVLIATALLNFCPLFKIVGISTVKNS